MMFDDDDFGDDFGDGFDDSFADSLKGGADDEYGSSQLGGAEPEVSKFDDSPATPLAWYQIWIQVMTQPNEESYRRLLRQPDISIDRSYMWVVVAGVLSSLVIAPLQVGTFLGFDQSVLPYLLCGIPALALFTIIAFALSSGAIHGIARMFGGKGSYAELTFLYGAITAPVTLFNLLTVIPLLGACISLLVSLYSLFLATLAIKTAHRFDWGRAIATLLLLIGAMFVVFFCGFFALSLLLGSFINEFLAQEGLLMVPTLFG